MRAPHAPAPAPTLAMDAGKYRLGLRGRLLLLVTLILGLATSATMVFLFALNSVDRALDTIVGTDLPRLSLAVQLSSQVQAVVARVPGLSRSISDAARESGYARIGLDLSELQKTLETLQQSDGKGPNGAIITELSGHVEDIRSNARQLDAIVSRRFALERKLTLAQARLETLRAALRRHIQTGGAGGAWQLDSYDMIMAAAGSQSMASLELQSSIDQIEHAAQALARAGAAPAALRADLIDATSGPNSPPRVRLELLRLEYLQETRLSVNQALSDRFVSAARQFGAATQSDVSNTAAALRAQLRSQKWGSVLVLLAIFGGTAVLATYVSYFLVRRLLRIGDNIRAYLNGEHPPPLAAMGQDEVGDIAAALNFFVKAIGERELALGAARDAAEAALGELRDAQGHLIQSEKMASLGQLVANVAHEINTPIGAIKSSGQSIAEELTLSLARLPPLLRSLDEASYALFIGLTSHADGAEAVLSTRDERSATRALAQQLAAEGLAEAQAKAAIMVQLRAHGAWQTYRPLLLHPQCDPILEAAYGLHTLSSNTRNINTALARVEKIVFALKTFSRVGSGGELVLADLREGMETVLTLYQNQIKQHCTLVREYAELPPILCLPDELNQVWTNLIYNALQAMQFAGTLTIGLHRVDDHAVMSVGDSGAGIAPEIRARIFDAFFTTKPIGEGSGLGLDIVKKIVDKHGGKIEVQSEVGVGTTFSVHLPYRPDQH